MFAVAAGILLFFYHPQRKLYSMKKPLLQFFICLRFLAETIPAFSQASSTKLVIASSFTKTLIDTISNTLQRYYIFLNKGIVMRKYLQQQYKKGKYRTLRDVHRLTQRLTKDLESVHADGHLYIYQL